jgi:hypothetical protein
MSSALAGSVAQATVSAGASINCDADNHCIEGTAWSSNGGVNLVSGVESGAAVAVCQGTGSPAATLIEITCSLGEINGRGIEETMSFPGTTGAVPLATTTNALERRPVCWSVTGIFPTGLGPTHTVSTSDCAQLAI